MTQIRVTPAQPDADMNGSKQLIWTIWGKIHQKTIELTSSSESSANTESFFETRFFCGVFLGIMSPYLEKKNKSYLFMLLVRKYSTLQTKNPPFPILETKDQHQCNAWGMELSSISSSVLSLAMCLQLLPLVLLTFSMQRFGMRWNSLNEAITHSCPEFSKWFWN